MENLVDTKFVQLPKDERTKVAAEQTKRAPVSAAAASSLRITTPVNPGKMSAMSATATSQVSISSTDNTLLKARKDKDAFIV